MMNEIYKTAVRPVVASIIDSEHNKTACAPAVCCDASGFTITDEDAEMLLPGYALAFEEYHKRRSIGESPEQALEATLLEWRAMWRQCALVPHRHQ